MVFGRKQQEWLEFRLRGRTQVTVVWQMPSGRTTAICEASDGFVLALLLFLYVNDMCSSSNKFKSHRLWLLIS